MWIVPLGSAALAIAIGLATLIVVVQECCRSRQRRENIPLEDACDDTTPIVYHPVNGDAIDT